MLQKVAVVDIARVLNKLVLRGVEVGVFRAVVGEVVSGSPPHSKHEDSVVIEQCNILPPAVLLRDVLVGDRAAYVLVVIMAGSLSIVSYSLGLVRNFLEDIKTNNRSIIFVGSVLRVDSIQKCLGFLILNIDAFGLNAQISVIVRGREETN